MALGFAFTIYVLFSFCALYCYGDRLSASIFDNISKENDFASFFIRALFLLIFLCNIPYIFLAGKEALLLMIDEAMNRTMSMSLMRRIDQL